MIYRKPTLLRALLIAIVAIAAVACFKSVTTKTRLIIKVLIEEKSGGDRVTTDDVIAYAYYTKNDDWVVASYDDAVNRIITDSLGTERRTVPDVEGEPFSKESLTAPYVSLPLTKSPAMVVVVSPQNRMYAYTFKSLNVENLHETYITLLLHSWKTKVYTEGAANKGGLWYIFPPTPEADATPDDGSTDTTTPDSEGNQTETEQQ